MRTKTTFLFRPRYEGHSCPCHESQFHYTTQESVRVHRLEDMRQGVADYSPEEYYELKGRQPIFYLSETFDEHHRYQWNGFLLFSHADAGQARDIVQKYRQQWGVVMAFTDPDTRRYYFLIDPQTEDFSDEGFLRTQCVWAEMLNGFLPHCSSHPYTFYTRALKPEYYDIVDSNALFGTDEPVETKQELLHCSCETQSISQIIRQFFTRTLKTLNPKP